MHFLVALWDGGGTVPVEIGVVRRLLSRGHSVTVLADPTLAADAADAGAEYRSWTRAPHRRSHALEDDFIKDWECRTPVALLNRLCERVITGPAAAYAADVREALSERPAEPSSRAVGSSAHSSGRSRWAFPPWPSPRTSTRGRHPDCHRSGAASGRLTVRSGGCATGR